MQFWMELSLRKKCSYSELFWSVFSRIRTEYGEILRISPYLVRMWENAGKMRTRITPNTGTFYAVFFTMRYIIPKPSENESEFGKITQFDGSVKCKSFQWKRIKKLNELVQKLISRFKKLSLTFSSSGSVWLNYFALLFLHIC